MSASAQSEEYTALIRDLMSLTDAIVEQHGLDTKAAGTAGMVAFQQLRNVKDLDPTAAGDLYSEFKLRTVPEPQHATITLTEEPAKRQSPKQ